MRGVSEDADATRAEEQADDDEHRLAELGEHEQALALAEDTLARRRRVLGEDHPTQLRRLAILPSGSPDWVSMAGRRHIRDRRRP